MSHHSRIDPLSKPTLGTMVAERLRELVVDGVYKPGDQLSEVDLAEKFGVSRGPVREGLRKLVNDGLLRSEPHHGAYVPMLGAVDIADIYRAREAIEGAAATAIVEDGHYAAVAGGLLRIALLMEKLAAADDWPKVRENDMRFHTELVRGSGSPRLARMYDILIDETRICLRMPTAYSAGYAEVGNHRQIAERLEAGDLAAVHAAMRHHFEVSLAAYGPSTASVANARTSEPTIGLAPA
jgi:DNA-binding GntR family transcriptional regulator